MEVDFNEIKKIQNVIFEEIERLIEAYNSDELIFMDEEAENLSNLQLALEDISKISWIYYTKNTIEMLQENEEIDKIGYYHQILFEMILQRSTKFRLLSSKYFKDFEWSNAYKELLNPIRKDGWSKRSTIKEYKQKFLIPYFNSIIEQLQGLKSNDKFDELTYNQLKLITVFLCGFIGYDMEYFDTDLNPDEVGIMLTEIIEISDKRDYDMILFYISDEIGMYFSESEEGVI